MREWKNKQVLLVGMARSGVAAARLLHTLGARLTVNDARERDAFAGALDFMDDWHVDWRLGQAPDGLIEGKDLIVFSSGVPFWSDWIQKARAMGIPCINELQLGFWMSKAPFVAITGTNGKTTTTTLIWQMFVNAQVQSFAVGNIGIPVCTHALEMQPEGVMVAEVAPFQLISTLDFRPRVSAILNITEDHLNWFHTMENYIDKKCLVFAHQRGDDVCILNADNAITATLVDRPQCRVMLFSHQKEVEEGAFVRDGWMLLRVDGKETKICPVDSIVIPGPHNLENAMAASLSAFLMGVSPEVIAHTLQTFKGVEHRIETVRTLNGVTYINDSKATNPDSTIKAIEAMKQPTVLILGGSDKKSDYMPMFRAFTPLIREVVVVGDTAEDIAACAKRAGLHCVHRAYSFEEALLTARDLATQGMNVLLSPACASYDFFDNFEQRGEVFKRLVWELK